MMLAVLATVVSANCWVAAGDRYHLPPYLLYSIAYGESSYNPDAIAHADNGTYSIGLMQVNSSWFDDLKPLGISEQDLYVPCTNVMVGAWILSQCVSLYGYTWQSIGCYYAGPYKGQLKGRKLDNYRWYSERVLQHWKQALEGKLQIDQQGTPKKRKPSRARQQVGDIEEAQNQTFLR